MSINLDEKINLIHEFIYNNLNNCYDIGKVDISKIKLDDIRIPNGKIQEEIYNQILNLGKIQFSFEFNNSLYFNVYTDGFTYLIKISSESIDKSNNDSLISYILSELVLKQKLNILLPILNIDIKVSSLDKFLKVKTNKFFEKNKKKIVQLKIRENFNKHYQSKNYNINWKVFLFLIIFTLIQIKKSFNEFKHNNLILENILVEEKANDTVYEINDKIYTLPVCNFVPKITNFEKSFISSKVSKNINESVILEEITDNDDDFDSDIDVIIDELEEHTNELEEHTNELDIDELNNDLDYVNNDLDDLIILSKDILKLNNNLNLETKKFLNKVIELNNMKYETLINDEYFDEFKDKPTKNKLQDTKNKLQDTKNKLQDTKNKLQDTKNKPTKFITKLQDTKNKLQDTKNKLQDTKNKLQDTKNKPTKFITKLQDTKDITLGNQKHLFTNKNIRIIKTEIDSTKTQEKKNVRTLKNELVGGFPYKSEKNTPFLTNDEKNTQKKRSAENPPREPPILLEQTIYDTSKAKQPVTQPPPAYIPVYDELGSAVATIPSFNNLSVPNPAYNQPFQKVYNISMSNPLTQYTTINRVFEDIIPGDPRSLSFNTVYERIQLKNFMRNIILDNVDGEEMCINGGKNSILSYIKLMEINPYSLKLNPFEDLAQNFLLFRAAYPIRYDNQKNNLEIAKESIGINIRLYNMSIGELRAEIINKDISKFDFDLWREIEYYKFIRDEILLKNVSPNFASMILYKVDSKSVIDWKQLSVGKSTINYSNSYKINELHNLKELNQILQQSRSKQKGPINLFWINMVNSDKNSFWLDIELTFKNNSNYNLKWLDPTKVEFIDFINKNKITSYPSILIEYNTRFVKYEGEKNLHELLNYLNNEILNSNKLDLTVSAGQTLILLTEAPNTNIIKWVSPIYEGYGSQVKMKATGYRSSNVWKSVIFQILYILAVLQEHEIYIRELTFENNFYIKDLFYDQANVKYWIYNIDDIDYYVPNYGYIVIFDSKFCDITSPVNIDLTMREFKICSNKLFNNNGSFKLQTPTFMNQMKEVINQSNFTNKLKVLGAHPVENEILNLIDNIFISTQTKIKDLFIIHFKEYLHNKIGTLLMTTEKELINSYYRPITLKGKMVVWRERFDQYKWAIYKEKDIKTSNKHIIIINNNEISVHQNALLGYPQNEKISLNNITDQQIIERYKL